ncbi:entericidin A/B family lipoprotein [Actibacterium sp. MT2.3-13A]|nr:entericidin A/B family lipoprotein [Actibacterium sp. MT2.3-13A]
MPLRLMISMLTLLALTACATVEGAGQDLSAAGNAVANSARKVKSSL